MEQRLLSVRQAHLLVERSPRRTLTGTWGSPDHRWTTGAGDPKVLSLTSQLAIELMKLG